MTTALLEMTVLDHRRLRELVDRNADWIGRNDPTGRSLVALRDKLAEARCLDGTDVSPETVTMGSTVHLLEVDTGEHWKFTLSYPTKANIDEGRISVLAPLGTAILGQRVGDVLDWEVPSGKIRIEIIEVVYQPEASGILDELEAPVPVTA
jgi:regulator of nucleoside diphosphate kinase